mgnify:CR=1 FL=1
MVVTLSDAIKSGRLQEFIAQEEALGVPPVDAAEFDQAVKTIARSPRSKDRTSRSAYADGSTGK